MSALYPAARQGFLTGAIDADTAVIKAALVRGYTYGPRATSTCRM
jgi:hypothetical protein